MKTAAKPGDPKPTILIVFMTLHDWNAIAISLV
jgi:hypothetical protein